MRSPTTPRDPTDNDPVVKTLLVSDLVDSTRLVEYLGDERAVEVFTRHDRMARDLLEDHTGREIDKTDGFLMLFERPLNAVLYGLAYHRGLEELAAEMDVELAARIGIHLGEVFLRENPPEDVARGAKPLEVEGLAKPMAARLMSLAEGRQTLLTRAAFDLARRAAVGSELKTVKLSWLAHGDYLFKGVEEPTDVFEVGIEDFAPLLAPASTGKARRAGGEEEILGWRPAPGHEVPEHKHWVLGAKLGAGGFGEVWLANHQKTGDQRVFKFCFDAERLRGLQREITIFRLLKETLGNRQDIVRIRDWSLDAPPYYIESDYNEGGDLLAWAKARGGLEKVSLGSRLDIVAQIGEALSAAHSVGVLHKDVKPANVLVRDDAEGRPRIQLTDFGVGLATDEQRLAEAGITVLGLTEVTAPGERSASTSGTQRFMAPEVVEGKAATVQADVYALGVILYQMVAGDFRRTLAPGWERDVEDELLREDIALAVDRSPSRRLSSPQALAERLRTLEDRHRLRATEQREREETRQARIALERSRKRRRQGMLVAVVTTLFAGAMGVQSWRVAQAAARANLEAEAARRVSEFMIDLFEVSDPGEARGNTITAREILDTGAERIDRELENQPQIRARMMDVIGRVYDNLGLYGQAAPRLETALKLRQQSGGDPLELATSLNNVGYLYWRQGKYAEAEPLLEQALEIREGILGEDHPDVAWVLDNLGSVYEIQERYTEAESLHRRALAIREQALGPDHLEVASSLDDLAVLYLDQGKSAEAEPFSRRGLAIREQALGADHHAVATSLNGLAIICANQGRLEEAEALFERTLEVRRKVLGDQHDAVAQSLNNLGYLYSVQGQPTEAEPLLLQALAIWEQNLGSEHRSVAGNLLALAGVYQEMDRASEAVTFYQRSVASWKGALGATHPEVARALRKFADFYVAQRRLTDAEALLREALDIWEQAPEADPEALEGTLEDLASVLRDTGRGAEAAELTARATAIDEGD